ncbi:MAG: SDR family oxidoreductase [Bacteroidales bacterium]
MKYFVTGATGYIGEMLVRNLVKDGHQVHCLYRNPLKTKYIEQENVTLFKGDILDRESLKRAARGCSGLFHTAAFTGIKGSDKEIYELNVTGTKNVLDAALEAGISEVVLTSTTGVIGPSSGTVVNESTARSARYFIKYEETKAAGEKVALEYIPRGLNIRIVNPSRVYGPGQFSDSNGVTRMILLYIKGRWRIIPGNGKSIGNYVYIDDVVSGHMLAMQKGKCGERYILGGENADFNEFFRIVSEISGRKQVMFRLPLPVMLAAAGTMEFISALTRTAPFVTRGLVRRYNHNWESSSGKAIRELGYSPRSLREGVASTISWLKDNNHI